MIKNKRLKLSFIVMMLSIIPLLLSLLMVGVVSIQSCKESIFSEINRSVYAGAKFLTQYYGDGVFDEHYEVIDGLLDYGIELTLFEGDTRLYSSIKENGVRIEGTKASDAVVETVLKQGKDYLQSDVKIADAEYTVCYMPIKKNGTDEIIGMAFAGIKQSEINREIFELVRNISVIGILVSVVIGFASVFISNRIIKPLSLITDEIVKLSDGNLTAKINTESKTAEIYALVESAKNLSCKLFSALTQINVNTISVDNVTNNTNEVVNSTRDNVNSINEIVNEFSKATMLIAESVQEINSNMINLGNDIDSVSTSVEDLTMKAENMLSNSEETGVAMKEAKDKGMQTLESATNVADEIKAMNESISDIRGVIDLIMDVASQTKLLSINASIEAAHAGEKGKGFAVVADSIKALSEQTEDSVKTVKDLLESIIEKSNNSVESVELIDSLVREEVSSIDFVNSKAIALIEDINNAIDLIKDISGKSVTLNSAKDGTISQIQDLSAASQENAASCQEIQANIETIAQSASSISEYMDKNVESVKCLVSIVSQYKLK